MSEQSTGKGFAVMSAAGLLSKVLSFLYVPLLIGIVGTEGYGIYASVYSVYLVVYVLGNSGFPVAISKRVAELLATGRPVDAVRTFRASRAILLAGGLFLSLVTAFLATPIAHLIHYDQAALGIRLLSPTLFFTSVLSSYRGYFQGRGNMTPTAVSQIIEQIVNAALTLLCAWLFRSRGLEWAVAGGTVGTAAGAFCAVIYLLWYNSKHGRIKVSRNHNFSTETRVPFREIVASFLHLALPFTLCITLQNAGNLVDVWNVKSRLLHAGFSDGVASGMYGDLFKFQQLLNAPVSVMTALAAAVLPSVAAAFARHDSEKLKAHARFAHEVVLWIAVPTTMLFMLLAEPIYGVLHYHTGVLLMIYGSSILIPMSLLQIQTALLQGMGQLIRMTLHTLAGIVAKIILNYIFVGNPDFNILGALIATFAGFLIPVILNTIFLFRSSVRIRSWQLIWTSIVSVFAAAVPAFLLHQAIMLLDGTLNHTILYFVDSALSTATGFSVFFIVLVLTGGYRKQNLNQLPAMIRNRVPHAITHRMK